MMLVPLKSLKHGGAIDSRSPDGEREIGQLANSIAHLGLILPLAVVADGTGYRVIDGNRRLDALKIVHKGKKNVEVPVHLQGAETDLPTARAMSLAANIERLPLHPMDQYEAFAKIAADGKALAEVAATFGLSERAVRQRMALGSLCLEAKEAYRSQRMSAGLAAAYTRVDPGYQLELIKSGESEWKQKAAIERLTSDGALSPSSGICRFVGRAAYIENGGSFIADLFVEEEQQMWADPQLVNTLASVQLDAFKEAALAEGWQFFDVTNDYVGQDYVLEDPAGEPVGLTDEEANEVVRLTDQLVDYDKTVAGNEEDYTDDDRREINSIEYQLGELQDDKRSWTEEQRSRLGVVVDSHYAVHKGAKRRNGHQPEREGDGAAGEDQVAEAKAATQSTAVMMELDSHLTNACRGALIDMPGTAIRLLALTWLSDYFVVDGLERLGAGVGARLDLTGNVVAVTDYHLSDILSMVKACGLSKAKNLEAKMKAMAKIGDEGIIKIIAWFTARSLMTRHRNSELTLYLDKVGALDIRQHYTPDFDNFFNRLTKEQLRLVLEEAGLGHHWKDNHWDTMKKAELAKAVAAALPDKWVPEAIRPTATT